MTFLRSLAFLFAAVFLAGAQCPTAGTFELQSVNSGRVLDVSQISKDNGAVVQQWDNWNGPNQQWTLLPVSGPYLGLDANGKPAIFTCANGDATVLWSASQSAVAAGLVIGTGGSGALAFDPASQTVDIVTSILPRKMAANSWTGRNDFTYLQVDATNTAPPCAATSDIGGIWFDSADANNTAVRYCVAVMGKIQWVER
jgi:hypothetical protein